MKEGPIGVRRYWTIGCLAIVLTMLCTSALPDKAGFPLNLVGPLVQIVGCAVLVLIGRRRLGAKANLAFIGPAVGAALAWGAYIWALGGGTSTLAPATPVLYLGITLLGVAMGAVVQFLIIGFVGQGGAVRKG